VDWRMKGLVQKALSSLPGGVRMNTSLQSIVGAMRNFDSNAASKISDWRASMGYLADANFRLEGARLVEIGTGWYPAFPLCFALTGAGSVRSFDVTRLLREKPAFRFPAGLENHLSSIADLAGVSQVAVHARFAEFRQSENLAQFFNRTGIEYSAPADGRDTGLEADSIDLVYSNSVLSHIPRQVVAELMAESFRILKPGGLIMHNICCNDHYAYFDKSISFVNFLKYDEQSWRLWNNSLQYQNRLRAPKFLELAAGAGFEVIQKKTDVRAGTFEALSSLRLAPEFERFSKEDVAATTLDFIARKPVR